MRDEAIDMPEPCLSVDMCADMCIDMYLSTSIVDMYTDMCIDMCIDMCMDMCMDTCMDMRHLRMSASSIADGSESSMPRVVRQSSTSESMPSPSDAGRAPLF